MQTAAGAAALPGISSVCTALVCIQQPPRACCSAERLRHKTTSPPLPHPRSYARNSCYRNHSRYTLCAHHYDERHKGTSWKVRRESGWQYQQLQRWSLLNQGGSVAAPTAAALVTAQSGRQCGSANSCSVGHCSINSRCLALIRLKTPCPNTLALLRLTLEGCVAGWVGLQLCSWAGLGSALQARNWKRRRVGLDKRIQSQVPSALKHSLAPYLVCRTARSAGQISIRMTTGCTAATRPPW